MFIRRPISRTNSHKLGNYQMLKQSNRELTTDEPEPPEPEITYPEIYEPQPLTFNLEIKKPDETTDSMLVVNPAINPINIQKKTNKIKFSLKQIVEHVIINK